MTAPTSPQPTPTAQWSGSQWIDWSPLANQWVPVTVLPPAPPVYPPAPVYPSPAVGYNAPPPSYGMQPPAQPPLTGSFKDLFQQRSGGTGKYLKFKDRAPGTTYWGIVARPVTPADVRAATMPGTSVPVPQRDGSVKWQLLVPLLVMPSSDHTDGRATMVVAGDLRDKLNAAMSSVGAPEHPDGGYVPEAGAFIQVTKVTERPVPGMNNQYIYHAEYRRPDDAFTQQKKAEIDTAHRHMMENPQPAAPPAVQPVYNPATGQYAPPTAPAPAHYTPPQPTQYHVPPAAGAQHIPPPSTQQPAVHTPAPSPDQVAQTYAAAAYVTSADAQDQPPVVPQIPPTVPPASNGAGQPPPPATAAPTAVSPAGAGGSVPQITEDQWRRMRPDQVAAIVTATGQRPNPAWGIQGVSA